MFREKDPGAAGLLRGDGETAEDGGWMTGGKLGEVTGGRGGGGGACEDGVQGGMVELHGCHPWSGDGSVWVGSREGLEEARRPERSEIQEMAIRGWGRRAAWPAARLCFSPRAVGAASWAQGPGVRRAGGSHRCTEQRCRWAGRCSTPAQGLQRLRVHLLRCWWTVGVSALGLWWTVRTFSHTSG